MLLKRNYLKKYQMCQQQQQNPNANINIPMQTNKCANETKRNGTERSRIKMENNKTERNETGIGMDMERKSNNRTQRNGMERNNSFRSRTFHTFGSANQSLKLNKYLTRKKKKKKLKNT